MTITQYQRDQLPDAVCAFIAYAAPTRMPDPVDATKTITARAQVMVRYLPGIVIKEVTGARNGSDKTAAIHFDPASIGWTEKLTAYLDPDDPLVEIARQSQASGQPVDVALETTRRSKTKTTKAAIPSHVPIHALRGAADASGGSGPAMQGTSAENISNRVAMINGKASAGLTSDPAEWKLLTKNKDGRIPPEGWKFYGPTDPAQWQAFGVAIPDSDAPANAPTSGPVAPADQDALTAALIAALASPTISGMLDTMIRAANSYPAGKGFQEGKPWDARTNDGRVNLGFYPVTAHGRVYRWAHAVLGEHVETLDEATLWPIVTAVMDMADQVQSRAYGRGVTPNRKFGSHTEAERWTRFVIDTDIEAHKAAPPWTDATWVQSVIERATRLLATSGKYVGDKLAADAAAAKAARDSAPAAPEAPSGPNPSVVNGLLSAIARDWNKPDALRAHGARAQERGLIDLPVHVENSTSGAPVFTWPVPDGGDAIALGAVLSFRINGGGGLEQPTATDTQPPTPTAPVQQPPVQQAPVQQAPAQQPHVPLARESAAPSIPREQPPATPGADAAVNPALMRASAALTNPALTMADLGTIYAEVRDAGLLDTMVTVTGAPGTRPRPCASGTSGARDLALGQVLALVRDVLGAVPAPAVDPAPTQAPVPAPAQAPVPEPAPAQQAAPTGRTAQDIANDASSATTLAQIDALITEAGPMMEQAITMQSATGPMSGPLRSYLTSCRRRLAQAPAGV